MDNKTLIGRFLIWRSKHINDRYFVIILSAIIGFLAGIAAYFLKNSVFFIERLLTAGFRPGEQNYWFFLYPAIGILLTVLFIRFIIKEDSPHGVPRILFVISKLGGQMKKHKAFSSIIGASLTAGFGGSIGLEAPIITSGSSVGSTLSQYLRLNYKTTILLLGCGAAGAMASIFTTPIAAVIFCLEVLMLDLTLSSIIPLLMASATGAITTKLLFAEKMLVHFEVSEPFVVTDVPYYILLGVLTGLISLYFSKTGFFVSELLRRYKNIYLRGFVGVSILGLLIFLFPPLYGEGYETIRQILTGNAGSLTANSFFYNLRDDWWVFSGFLILLILLKVFATFLTIESGGIGGIFAPAAVTGGIAGFTFARIFNETGLFKTISESNFTLVGMAGVLAAVLHAPLTAIFLIAEMTNGYELIVPLMLTATIAFITIKTFDPHSIFTKKLAEKGELITHHKDQAVLTLLSVKDVIDVDLQTISPEASLGDLTQLIAKSKRNLFPVVDQEGYFRGLIILDDVREDMFIREKYGTPIASYLRQPLSNEKVSVNESMEAVMEKFNLTGNYNLVVLDNGRYLGFVSRANVFSAYRKTLIDVTQD
jgi:chloride channel protein, CIC family